MDRVLSHISALEFWRSVRMEPWRYREVSRARYLIVEPPNAKALTQPGPWWLSRPLHVLVANAGVRRVSSEVVSHVWSGSLPKGSVLDAGNGFYVVSPELCFVQAVESMEFTVLIALGYELCGTYDTAAGDMRECEPLTTAAKLKTFVSKNRNLRGGRKAERALRYCADGSASPMETVLVMLLCLPVSLGGYGLPMPLLNHRIDMWKRAKREEKGEYYICDLYWPEARFAVEYDSNWKHTGATRIASDAIRRGTLGFMDIDVETVTWFQVSREAEMEKVARNIAKRLGHRLRKAAPETIQTRHELRRTLLRNMWELSRGRVARNR